MLGGGGGGIDTLAIRQRDVIIAGLRNGMTVSAEWTCT